jgi:hypothetical protein
MHAHIELSLTPRTAADELRYSAVDFEHGDVMAELREPEAQEVVITDDENALRNGAEQRGTPGDRLGERHVLREAVVQAPAGRVRCEHGAVCNFGNAVAAPREAPLERFYTATQLIVGGALGLHGPSGFHRGDELAVLVSLSLGDAKSQRPHDRQIFGSNVPALAARKRSELTPSCFGRSNETSR